MKRCCEGGLHKRGHHEGGAITKLPVCQKASGTHPTGMHSCCSPISSIDFGGCQLLIWWKEKICFVDLRLS